MKSFIYNIVILFVFLIPATIGCSDTIHPSGNNVYSSFNNPGMQTTIDYYPHSEYHGHSRRLTTDIQRTPNSLYIGKDNTPWHNYYVTPSETNLRYRHLHALQPNTRTNPNVLPAPKIRPKEALKIGVLILDDVWVQKRPDWAKHSHHLRWIPTLMDAKRTLDKWSKPHIVKALRKSRGLKD